MKQPWQQALNHWDAWVSSINQARYSVEDRFGSFTQLVRDADFIQGNSEAQVLWELYDEVHKKASDFVKEEIQLPPRLLLHQIFRKYWMKTAFPEALKDAYIASYTTDNNKRRDIWTESRVIKEKGVYKVVDSVNWYSGTVGVEDITEVVKQTRWPTNYEHMIEKAKGGRPEKSKETQIYPEAIVCAILKDKQGLTYKKIAEIFHWTLSEDQYGEERISNTAVSRVKLGRKILKHNKNIK
jgi:hypothetical protein